MTVVAIRPCYPMGRVASHRGTDKSNEGGRSAISELQPFGIHRRLRRSCRRPTDSRRSAGIRTAVLRIRASLPSSLPRPFGGGGGGSDASSEIMTERGGGGRTRTGQPRPRRRCSRTEEARVIFRGEKIKAESCYSCTSVISNKAALHFIFDNRKLH